MLEVGLHKTDRRRSPVSMRGALLSGIVTALTLVFSGTSMAQDSGDNSGQSDGFSLNVETPFSDSAQFPNLSNAIELPTESLGSQIFDLDTTDFNCRTGGQSCLTRDQRLDMRYTKSLRTSIDSLVDIELTPRASMLFDDGTSSTLVGALVRIGDDLKDGDRLKSNTWYMFAGADAEAVTYAPNSMRRVSAGDFHLQDRIIVGDAQAGVGYRIGRSTDISLGYFRREVTSLGNDANSENTSYSEDAAALSFTWRR